MENQKRVAEDYTRTMNEIQNTIAHYDTKRDIIMYLDAIKTSVTFTLKITKQVMKGRK
jgi:hypothetical protein